MIATGLLRIRSDNHWLGDVLTGWAVGFTVGLVDLPGPIDLFRFEYPTAKGVGTGTLLPSVDGDTVGARLELRF